eukprot:6237355-Lingulodinium_polyedra.AAC.1
MPGRSHQLANSSFVRARRGSICSHFGRAYGLIQHRWSSRSSVRAVSVLPGSSGSTACVALVSRA